MLWVEQRGHGAPGAPCSQEESGPPSLEGHGAAQRSRGRVYLLELQAGTGGANEAASAAAFTPQPHFRGSCSFLGFRTSSSKERSGQGGCPVHTVAAAGVGRNCLEKWRCVGRPWRNESLRGEAGIPFLGSCQRKGTKEGIKCEHRLDKGTWGEG